MLIINSITSLCIQWMCDVDHQLHHITVRSMDVDVMLIINSISSLCAQWMCVAALSSPDSKTRATAAMAFLSLFPLLVATLLRFLYALKARFRTFSSSKHNIRSCWKNSALFEWTRSSSCMSVSFARPSPVSARFVYLLRLIGICSAVRVPGHRHLCG